MPAFRVSGANGQAPTTSYFGYAPDKYTMLLPTYYGLKDDATNPKYLTWTSAPYLNNFVPWNLSFGGGSNTPTATFTDFITAPDGGTTTMQRLAETTANTQHFASAGQLHMPNMGGVLRFAGFFKSAGRRIILNLNNAAISFSAGLPVGGTGCKAIFDLAGGQVAVAAATYGSQASQWRAVGQGIIPFGNGVYLCYIDALSDNRTIAATADTGRTSDVIFALVYLDNGTGTNIESSTYAGDGTSGVYGWRMNLMPIQAYSISGTVLFDDFLSTSTIDTTNSYAPGFNWYGGGGGWHYDQNSETLNSLLGRDYTVANSIVTCIGSQNSGHSNNGITLRSAAPLDQTVQNGPIVGNVWNPPFMIEVNSEWDYTDAGRVGLGADDIAQNVSSWTWSFEWVNGMLNIGQTVNPPIGLMGYEYDLFESCVVGGCYLPTSTYISYAQRGVSGGSAPSHPEAGDTDPNTPEVILSNVAPRAPQWSPVQLYGNVAGQIVYNIPDATFYLSSGITFNSRPPGANWTTSLGGVTPPIVNNMDAYHTWMFMRLPYLSGKGVVSNSDPNTNTTTPGMILQFFDGLCFGANPIYAPWSNITSPYCVPVDYQHVVLNHAASQPQTDRCHTNYNIDWVRVSR